MKVAPVCTVSVNDPVEFHTPRDCVVPSEKIRKPLSPFSPACNRVTGLDATALLRPEMVTLSPPEFPDKSVSETSVTVILFVTPGNGVLCPRDLVVKDWQLTVLACKSNSAKSETERNRLRQAFFADAACA